MTTYGKHPKAQMRRFGMFIQIEIKRFQFGSEEVCVL